MTIFETIEASLLENINYTFHAFLLKENVGPMYIKILPYTLLIKNKRMSLLDCECNVIMNFSSWLSS